MVGGSRAGGGGGGGGGVSLVVEMFIWPLTETETPRVGWPVTSTLP